MVVEDGLDHPAYIKESDSSGKEHLHRLLISSAQRRRPRAPAPADFDRHLEQRIALGLPRLEGEAPSRDRIEPGYALIIDPVRVEEGVLDRQDHVGRTYLSLHRAVVELDHRVDDALRVDYDLDLLPWNAEQMMGFNYLEGLVHKRRGVDGYLRPHLPCGVGQGLLGRDSRKVGQIGVAEGAPGSRYDEPGYASVLAPEALPDRVRLAVHRQQRHAVLTGVAHDQVSGHYDGLLVGERDILARFHGGKCGAERDIADCGGHDHVDVRVDHHLIEPALHRPTGENGLLLFGRPAAGEQPWPELFDLRLKRGQAGVGCQPYDAEAFRKGADDLKSLGADRTRRSQYCQPLGPATHRAKWYTTTRLGTIESSLSRMPPWPGTIHPESSTPPSRFRRDIRRSPACPATPSTVPRT